MHSDLDLNERFDREVQRFAEQFGFDVMIVQEAYEQCLQPNRFTEGEYHDLKSDRKKLGDFADEPKCRYANRYRTYIWRALSKARQKS